MCRIIAHTKIINYLCSRKATHRAQIIPPKCFPHFGEMVEWSITAVLKTAALRGAGGSNPSLSARKVCQNARLLFLCTKPRLSQAGALLLPKDFVSLGIRISL